MAAPGHRKPTPLPTFSAPQRTEFLGYVDSGMMGEPTNDAPGSFWTAPIDEAAERLAVILREENADVLTIYDDNGNYGHPDHIQVHRVGVRAAELAGTPRVFQLTMNRDHLDRGMDDFVRQAREAGMELPEPDPDADTRGKPESEITAAVDVSTYVDDQAGRDAGAREPDRRAVDVPGDAGRRRSRYVFGTEWAIRDGQGPGITETDLMAGL